MKTFKIEITKIDDATTKFSIGFGEPAQNTAIVAEVAEFLANNPPAGGELALITGPASLPVAGVLYHSLLHIFGSVAVFDPKLGGYVVVSAHGGNHKVGDLIEE